MSVALLPLIEGETLSSNFGRYADFMGLKSTSNLRRKLFGYKCARGTRLPSAIDYLAQQTRDYWNLSGEQIARGFTEFQYVTMMLRESAREKLLGRMLANRPNGGWATRIIRYNDERTTKLRYCPECLLEWKRKQEPPYWKIDHQLVGVYCCVKHSCILKSAKMSSDDRVEDCSVLSVISDGDESILGEVDSSRMQAIESIARKSALIRSGGGVRKSASEYRDMFKEAGFSHTGSDLKRDSVVAAWLEYFGNEYCHMTYMSVSRVSAFIERLSSRTNSREFPHPFMFIAAECLAEHKFSQAGSYLPGGGDNLPVLLSKPDVIAPDFQRAVCTGALHRDTDVIKCEGMLRRSGSWKLVCTCGISYRVRNTSQFDSEKMAPFLYGERYQMRFRELIAKGKSIQVAAKELNVNQNTVWFWSRKIKGDDAKKFPERKIKKLRAQWSFIVENTTSQTRITTAAKENRGVYAVLLKSDRDWLIEFNRGQRSWRPKSSYKVNEPTMEEIYQARQELITADPPVRCTRIAILEKLGYMVGQIRDKPCSAILSELAESHADYLERVIAWLATLALEQRLDGYDEAIRLAGLRIRSFTREQRSRIREIASLGVGHEK